MSRTKIAALFCIVHTAVAFPAVSRTLIAPKVNAQTITIPPYTDSQAQSANAAAISAAQAAATAAANASAAASYMTPTGVSSAITAATPSPCSTPAADTLLGSAGSATPCMARPDSTRPTPVQTINTTLNADCTWSVTFSCAFSTSTPIVHANVQLAAGATQPIPCAVISRSTTTQSGKCFPGQATLLSLAIVTSGLSLNPFSATCTAGTPVMVAAREPTQGS